MQGRLHIFRWTHLAKSYLHRIVFKNDPSIWPVMQKPLHRKLWKRVVQKMVHITLYPFLWLKEFTVLDPHAKFAFQMWVETDESAEAGELVFAIDTTFFDKRETHSGLWSYRKPGFWHCHDSHTVPMSEDTVDDYRDKYLLATGVDPFKKKHH